MSGDRAAGGTGQRTRSSSSRGRLALSTERLTVQLRPEFRQTAEEIFKSHGCRILERLNLAPGVFRVELTRQAKGDALDVANELVNSSMCEFAEPELIEVTGGR